MEGGPDTTNGFCCRDDGLFEDLHPVSCRLLQEIDLSGNVSGFHVAYTHDLVLSVDYFRRQKVNKISFGLKTNRFSMPPTCVVVFDIASKKGKKRCHTV